MPDCVADFNTSSFLEFNFVIPPIVDLCQFCTTCSMYSGTASYPLHRDIRQRVGKRRYPVYNERAFTKYGTVSTCGGSMKHWRSWKLITKLIVSFSSLFAISFILSGIFYYYS